MPCTNTLVRVTFIFHKFTCLEQVQKDCYFLDSNFITQKLIGEAADSKAARRKQPVSTLAKINITNLSPNKLYPAGKKQFSGLNWNLRRRKVFRRRRWLRGQILPQVSPAPCSSTPSTAPWRTCTPRGRSCWSGWNLSGCRRCSRQR